MAAVVGLSLRINMAQPPRASVLPRPSAQLAGLRPGTVRGGQSSEPVVDGARLLEARTSDGRSSEQAGRSMAPPAERVVETRAVEEDYFERAAAELRPAWAPDTVGDAMADFAAAAAAERAEAEARGLAHDAEPSIVVQEDLVRAAELAAAGVTEPRRAPAKSREAYPETYVGFAPTRPSDDASSDADNVVGSRASQSSYGVASAFGPGQNINAVPGAFAPASFPALDDVGSKSVLEQALRGAGLATLARRHARLIGIVCAASVLLSVLVFSLRGANDAPVAAPASVPAAKPAVAVTPLPTPSVESPAEKPGLGTQAASPSPVGKAAAPVEPARPAVASKKPAAAPRVSKPAPKAKVLAVKPTPKLAAKPAPKPAAKPVVKATVAKPTKATGKAKPQAQPAKRERSPIDALNPWGN
jgi:hypothetical protein